MLAGYDLPAAPRGSEAERWENILADYWFYADRFGWTPQQVDDQPAVILDRLREVHLTVEEHRREQDERAAGDGG